MGPTLRVNLPTPSEFTHHLQIYPIVPYIGPYGALYRALFLGPIFPLWAALFSLCGPTFVGCPILHCGAELSVRVRAASTLPTIGNASALVDRNVDMDVDKIIHQLLSGKGQPTVHQGNIGPKTGP